MCVCQLFVCGFVCGWVRVCVQIPTGITGAALSWTHRYHSQAPFADPAQRYFFSIGGQVVFVTTDGVDAQQINRTERVVDVSAVVVPLQGSSVELVFHLEAGLGPFTIAVDDIAVRVCIDGGPPPPFQLGCAVDAVDLVAAGGFESGLAPWDLVTSGQVAAVVTTDDPLTGNVHFFVDNAQEPSNVTLTQTLTVLTCALMHVLLWHSLFCFCDSHGGICE